MYMLVIERLRSSENGSVHPDVWPQIAALESRAHQIFLDFVHESGAVVGEDYSARIVSGTYLDIDLQPYIGNVSHECFVLETNTDYSSTTSVFDMTATQGVHRERPKPSGKPDYWEPSDNYWGRTGSRLLGEIFEPGKYPELSELAEAKQPLLVDPSELPTRIMSPEEYRRAVATAKLGHLTISHLGYILQLYSRIAYSGSELVQRRGQDINDLHTSLLAGESVGLRNGTKYLDCAKHELRASSREDQLKTWLYLNYDIPIGPVNLHFREDIEMAVEFGEQSQAYFNEQGISAK